jgi:predicted acyl esterase
VDKLTAEQDAEARYTVLVDKDVDVPMRDGVRLKADIFRPHDSGEVWPQPLWCEQRQMATMRPTKRILIPFF